MTLKNIKYSLLVAISALSLMCSCKDENDEPYVYPQPAPFETEGIEFSMPNNGFFGEAEISAEGAVFSISTYGVRLIEVRVDRCIPFYQLKFPSQISYPCPYYQGDWGHVDYRFADGKVAATIFTITPNNSGKEREIDIEFEESAKHVGFCVVQPPLEE